MSEKTKKYVMSSVVTFISAFALAILPTIDSLSIDSFIDGSIIAVLFTGIRAGIKALIEWAFVPKQ